MNPKRYIWRLQWPQNTQAERRKVLVPAYYQLLLSNLWSLVPWKPAVEVVMERAFSGFHIQWTLTLTSDKAFLKKSCPWLNINHQGSKQVLSQADQKLGIKRYVSFYSQNLTVLMMLDSIMPCGKRKCGQGKAQGHSVTGASSASGILDSDSCPRQDALAL